VNGKTDMSTATEINDQTEGREGLASMIRRVKIRNYKSIKSCDVELKPFTILVGRNGSGKSNFLDALRFVGEGLRNPAGAMNWSLSPWGGVADAQGEYPDAWIELELRLDEDSSAEIALCLRRQPGGILGFSIREEKVTIRRDDSDTKHFYYMRDGQLVGASVKLMPATASRGLYLPSASALPEFRPAFDALTGMGFYDLVPEAMRAVETGPSDFLLLARNGANLASVFHGLEERLGDKIRLLQYLNVIIPQVIDVRYELLRDAFPYLVFDLDRSPSNIPISFVASGMSDGTLRALGILVAINQLANDGRPIRLVGIEEPETALHPAASGALMDAFREAATHTQVLITTHSADLLDRYDPDEDDHLLLATMNEGATRITEIDPASKRIIRKHLDTAGGLLRMDQLEPEPADLERQYPSNPTPGGNGES
jgi:predicted ATPase